MTELVKIKTIIENISSALKNINVIVKEYADRFEALDKIMNEQRKRIEELEKVTDILGDITIKKSEEDSSEGLHKRIVREALQSCLSSEPKTRKYEYKDCGSICEHNPI